MCSSRSYGSSVRTRASVPGALDARRAQLHVRGLRRRHARGSTPSRSATKRNSRCRSASSRPVALIPPAIEFEPLSHEPIT